jgi:hypothetical protein
MRTLKWKRHSKHFLIATHENFLWVMMKAEGAGKPNRFNLVEVTKENDLSRILGRELPPGQCRKIATKRLHEKFAMWSVVSESADIWAKLRSGSKRALLNIKGPIVDRVAKARPSLNQLVRELLLDFDDDKKTWDLNALGRRVRKHGARVG